MSLSTLLQDFSWDDMSSDMAAFVEEPVPLDVFIRDRRYLGNPPLGEIQFEAVRHIERVYLPPTYELLATSADRRIKEYWSTPCRMVNLIELEWGKGSGKDHICRISALRVAYLLLCLASPQGYYQLPEQDSIHVLNVASSSKQASRAFFTPMRRAVIRPGNWFQTMGVDVVEAPRGPRSRAPRRAEGKESAQALLDTIRFARNVEAVSGHSDADSQEGLNLILGIMDEVDAFRSRAELARSSGSRTTRESSSSAEAVLEMLRTSGSTRFPVTYKSVRISYPRYKGSPIQTLIAEGKADLEENGDKSRHYVSGPKATWEVNPRINGREDFAEDYKKDPIMAAAKYECLPTWAINPYFANEIAVRGCTRPGPLPLQVDYERDGLAWKPVYLFSADLYPVKGALYAMHADLAVTGDRAGVTLAHVKTWRDVTVVGEDEFGHESSLTESRPVVKVDFSIAYSASAEAQPPREIQIRWARELCLELRRRGFIVARFTFDSYQSTDGMQILETHGIETDKYSMDKSEEGWRTLRDVMYEGRLDMPDYELAIVELLGLNRMPNGKVDHPADGSKDVADSLGAAVVGALVLGGREDDDGARAYLGGMHDFGGQLDESLQPLGMVPLSYLVTEDPLPDEVRNDRMSGEMFAGGAWYDDFGDTVPNNQ